MIDEELYQRATDELNSDRRRAHLWARACALSSDDHDEARYLYTNLRVEELIAERESAAKAAPPSPGGDASPSGGSALAEPPAELELEALAPRTGAPDGDDPTGFLDAELDAVASDFRSPADAPPGRAETDPQPVSFDDMNDIVIGDAQDAEAFPDVREDRDDAGGSDEPAMAFEDAPASRPPDAAQDFLPPAVSPEEMRSSSRTHETLELVEPTMESASGGTEGMATVHAGGRPRTGARFDVSEPADIEWEEPDGWSGPDARTTLGDADRQLDEVIERGGANAAARRAFGDRVRNDYADARDLDSLLEDHRRPGTGARDRSDDVPLDVIEDDDGPGRRWSVLEAEDGGLRAIRRGVSWPALVATLPWLLARGLVGTAIVYAALWIVSLGGVLMTGFAWRDAGPAASDATVFAFAGFAAIAFAGLVIVPFLRANRWRARKLARRGWELAGELRARSAVEAIDRFRELDVDRH